MWHYVCDPYEDPVCGCLEAQPEFEEDQAYDEARERAAGWDE